MIPAAGVGRGLADRWDAHLTIAVGQAAVLDFRICGAGGW